MNSSDTPKPHTSFHRHYATSSLFALIIPTVLWLFPLTAWAEPKDAPSAEVAVKGWLRADQAPLQTAIGQEVKQVLTYNDANGKALYHVVFLKPNGFVIVAADDQIEPIIAFSPASRFDPSPKNPLWALVSKDLPNRHAHVKAMAAAGAKGVPVSATKAKWDRIMANGNLATGKAASLPSISDVRVSPMLQSLWSQDIDDPLDYYGNNNACYNYYTPPYAAGSVYNYPCGCVATATGQLMRYLQWPTTSVGKASFTVTVDGNSQTLSLLGGDGNGGKYNWSIMVLDPAPSSTLAQRQEIGTLMHDVGAAVKMDYSAVGSGAWMIDAKTALVSTFGYANAIDAEDQNGNLDTSICAMVNTNLDAGFPVMFGIDDGDSGHAVVGDGYGYSQYTIYHHLNLGWAGDSNAWYNLPTIDTSQTTFTTIDDCTYNIWPTGTGEIISGRVTDLTGNPMSGVSLTATRTGGGTYTATSNSRGIYAFAKIPSSSTYTISASKSGFAFANQTASTGLSQDGTDTTGNKWGINFTPQDATVPVLTTTSPLPSATVGVFYSQTLVASGGTTPYTWSIAQGSLPEGLSLSNVGVISGTPTSTGTSTFTVQITGNNSKYSTSEFTLTTYAVFTGNLAAAVNQSSLSVTNSGALPWFPQATVTHDGLGAAQSGAITNSQTSGMQTTVTGPGTFSFWWKVSSESGYDFLTFYLDGASQTAISGEVDWQQKSYTVTSGIHTLKWVYSKDSSGSNGSDCGWVDQLTLPTPIAPTITTINPLPTVATGDSYSLTLAASGGATPYTWSISSGALPTGMSLTSAGVISGSCTSATTASFTVQVKGNDGMKSTQAFSLGVVAPGGPLAVAMNQSSLAFTAAGTLPWSSETTTTHDGASAAKSGAITNGQTSEMQTKTTGPGTCSFWWKVSSRQLYDYLTFYIDGVAQAQGISGEVDWQQRSYTLTSGIHTLKWVYSKGLSGKSGSDCGWVDQLVIPTPPTITSSSPLPPATVDAAYNQTLTATGGLTPYSWSLVSGTLPAGLSWSSTGVVSGVPTAASSASFTFQVQGSDGLSSTKAFTLTSSVVPGVLANAVNESGLTVTSSGNLPWFSETTTTHDGISAAQSGTITDSQSSVMQTTVTGPGAGSFWWKVSSELNCDKLTFYIDNVAQGASISGVVDWQQKTYSLTTGSHILKWIYAKDASGSYGSDCGWVDQLVVPAPPTITTTSPLPSGTTGTAYSQTLAASGGATPYTWALASGSLPAGLSLSSAGVISGTPTTATTASFTVRVTGNDTLTSTQAFSLTIAAPIPTYTVTFDAQGGTSPTPATLIVTYNSTYGSLATTSRSGYDFGGWWTGVGGTGTQVTSTTVVSITGAQTLYAYWTVSYTSWLTLLPANQSGPTQIPMKDGVNNLLKFACNLNTSAPDTRRLKVGANGLAGLPGVAFVNGKLRIEYLRRKACTNPCITYTIQFAPDNSTWVDYTGTSTVTSIDGTWERVVVDDPSSGRKGFARLKVVTNP